MLCLIKAGCYRKIFQYVFPKIFIFDRFLERILFNVEFISARIHKYVLLWQVTIIKKKNHYFNNLYSKYYSLSFISFLYLP